MLQNLEVSQVEQALLWLTQPELEPPEELRHLNEMEWFLLSRMLESLMLEKHLSPLH